MQRRKFVSVIAGAVATWPLAVSGQQTDRIRRIGLLTGLTESDQTRLVVLRQSLQALGWIEGRNIRIEYCWAAGSSNRMIAYAEELIASQPDAILALGSTAMRAIGKSPTIPIVFTYVTDPVGEGYVTSLARPGGNATGFTGPELTVQSKLLPLLKMVAPGASRVTIMFGVETVPGNRPQLLQKLEADAKALGMRAEVVHVRDINDIVAMMSRIGQEPGGCLVVLFDIFTLANRATIIALANRHRLPAAYGARSFADDGGLMSYGVDSDEVYRGAANYIDRILKGAKPADLPVQQPTRYEFIINIKTAQALGLVVPHHSLLIADEVIE